MAAGCTCNSGSGSVTKLDTSKFEDAMACLKKANENFSSAKENIDSQSKQLLDCWKGEGAKKFDISYWRLKRELDDEEETLIALADNLQQMYNSYREWDSTMASNINGSASNPVDSAPSGIVGA